MSELRCRDKCGATAKHQQHAENLGWSWLPITGSWRCGACAGALYRASSMRGTDQQTVDQLPANSLGAIERSTAHTITPPSVKG